VTILSMLPLTAIGKPFKLELRRLATRDELSTQLEALSYRLPREPWCHIEDGRIAVVLPEPVELKADVESVLKAYAIEWRFT
jgi:fatty-acyl-CoA synthase